MKPKSRIIKLPSLHVELLMDGLDRDLSFTDTCLANLSTNEASMTGAVAAIQTSCHMKQLSLAPLRELVSQADGWLLNWMYRPWESSGLGQSNLLATAIRSPRVLATSLGPSWWDRRRPTTIRREQLQQEDMGRKVVSSNPVAGKGIFSSWNLR